MAGMAQVQLARLYEAQSNLTNAVAMYEAFLRRPETAPHFRLHAYAHLFRLKQALGDTISANVNLQTARSLALQSNDAELQLNLAQYFLLRRMRSVGQQLLDVGIESADAVIRTERDPQKRLWWEYLIARRLDDFQQYGRLGDRAGKIDQALLQNPLLDVDMRLATYCYLIRALEFSGRWTEAEALSQKLIQAVPEDSPRLGHVLDRLAQQARNRGEFALARQFAIEAFREAPTSYVSQFMYLRVAAEDFNAGRYADALAKVTELERAVPVSGLAPKTWPKHFRADCQYVKGRCLKATGNTTHGQRLVAEAVAQKRFVAQLYDLREPSSPTP